MDYLVSGLLSITWQQWVMYVVGAVLIYLAIKKEFEPSRDKRHYRMVVSDWN